jgi:tRNA 2-thiocytidine biosynthesis protein TtcA
VIRPLVYVEESDIIKMARQNAFPVIDCGCPMMGQVDQKRQRMKQLLSQLHKENRYLKRSMIRALSNVRPRHLLDREMVRLLELDERKTDEPTPSGRQPTAESP